MVYFVISIGGSHAGRIVFKLFHDTAPLAAENFALLCTGKMGKGRHERMRHYKGSIFHKVFPGFLCMGGDYITNNGFYCNLLLLISLFMK